ncbi:MAG: carbohydrate kinase, YjeF related protein [Frankiales bacterium]|nr:carbohydrate kinase, YjeF related protein [Frankiales bacterium]
MIRAHTVAQVRAAEEPLLKAGAPLMARASTALAVEVARRLPFLYGARVVLLVGTGNNGADALWAGAWLARRGASVVAVLAAAPVQDALEGFLRAGGRVGTEDALDGAEAVLDGLVGIGGRGPLRSPVPPLTAVPLVVAVDVPSGVDADTGQVHDGAVRADVTVTFGTAKPGLLIARDHVGELVVVDIGLDLSEAPVEALTGVRAWLPSDARVSDKYTRGVVGVAAGSTSYSGAALLCVGAAIRAGAGMVRYAGTAAERVRDHWPEAVVTDDLESAGRVQAWVVGPGIGTDSVGAVEHVLAQDVPVVVDADALTICAEHQRLLRDRSAATLLTPHDREYERFGQPVGPDRIGAARRLAEDLGVHVLLKGDATVVVGPTGPARVNTTGSPLLATAGTGDVLAGGIGALLARGLDVFDAASVGAFLHGRAAALSTGGVTTSAGLVLEAWPAAVREALLRD